MIKSKCFIRDVFGLRSGPCFYGFLMMSKFWNDLTFIVAREHHIFIRMKCCLLAQVLSVWQKSEESGLILQLLDQEKMTGIQQGMWVKLCLFFSTSFLFFSLFYYSSSLYSFCLFNYCFTNLLIIHLLQCIHDSFLASHILTISNLFLQTTESFLFFCFQQNTPASVISLCPSVYVVIFH